MIPRNVLQVLAVALISATAVLPLPVLSAFFATVGLMVTAAWVFRPELEEAGRPEIWAGLAGASVVLASQYLPLSISRQVVPEVRRLWVLLAVLACLFLALSSRSLLFRRLAVALSLASVVAITGLMASSEWESEDGVDVYLMHQAAGDALVAGENPYGDAVRVPDGNPFAPEGSVIEGYPYPPVVLVTYGLAATVVDPRSVAAIAWLGILTWLVIRSRASVDSSGTKVSTLLLVATAPAWPAVWLAGWTEPLSLFLFLTGAVLWKRRPVVSSVLLGLAIASKQYLVLLVPLLIVMGGERRWQRVGVALGTAALTLLPPLLIDPSAFFNATFVNLASIGFRPDTQSLSGLLYGLGIDLYLPNALWIVFSLVLVLVVGRGAKSAADFLVRGSLALGLSFLIGQANPNYWFLVMGMAAIGVALICHETSAGRSTTPLGSGLGSQVTRARLKSELPVQRRAASD